jgi:hypothetical protein
VSSIATSAEKAAAEHRLPASKPRVAVFKTVILLLIAIAIGRIAATYTIYNQTMDEPEHIAGGLEWWQRAKFTLDDLHVPLGPALIGLAPTLSGARMGNTDDAKAEGAAYLNGGNYFLRLTLARLGVLPLFILAAIVVALWARRLGGDIAAAAGVLLFTTTPPVLAHAGLATTDTAAEATFIFALFAFVLWLSKPSLKSALLLGLAGGLALAAKLTNVPYLLCAGGAIVLARLALQPRGSDDATGKTWQNPRLATLALSIVCALLLLWGMYFFSWGVVGQSNAPITPGWAQMISTWHVPAPALWRSVIQASVLSHTGKVSYLLGSRRLGGSVAFFPVALLVKTPIPFLALAFVGSLLAALNSIRGRDWKACAPLLGGAAVMVVAMSSNLNIGLRHILALYPLVAIVGGYGVAELWKLRPQLEPSARNAVAVAIVVLLGWQVIESALVHPDYLPYFNQFAAGQGQEILVDSDLDWGQDLFRLSKELQARHIDHLWLSYFGSAEPERLGISGATELPTFKPVTGWIAISEFHLKRFPTAFAWLKDYRPVTRVGKSILLYHVEPAP